MRDHTPLCSPEQESELLEALRAGNYHEPACASLGVDYTAFKAWIVRGESEPDGPYRAFYDRVRQAEGQSERELVGVFRDFAKTDWRAAASFTGRRYPQRWSEQGQHREPGAGGVTINVGIALSGHPTAAALPAKVWTKVPELTDED